MVSLFIYLFIFLQVQWLIMIQMVKEGLAVLEKQNRYHQDPEPCS